MQAQAGLLLLAFDGHLPDVRLLGSHPDGLRIECVGLVGKRSINHAYRSRMNSGMLVSM